MRMNLLCLKNSLVCFAVEGCKKRLTSLFCYLSIAYVFVVYVFKSAMQTMLLHY